MSIKLQNIKRKLANRAYINIVGDDNYAIMMERGYDSLSLAELVPYMEMYNKEPKCRSGYTTSLVMNIDSFNIEEETIVRTIRTPEELPNGKGLTEEISYHALSWREKSAIYFFWLLDNTPANSKVIVDLRRMRGIELELIFRVLSRKILDFELSFVMDGFSDLLCQLEYLEFPIIYMGKECKNMDDLMPELLYELAEYELSLMK